MKKIIALVLVLGIGIAGYLFYKKIDRVEKQLPDEEIQESQKEEEEIKTEESSESEATLQSSFEEYNPIKISKELEITPTDDYATGTFCRFYYDENKSEFFATFGTGQGQIGSENYIGGGEGGQGAAYAYYSPDMKATGETGYYIYGGGDLATNKIENFLYHLSGGKDGWKISKFDISTWKKVDEESIKLDKNQGGNDEMLASINGLLDASSGYGEEANGADTSNEKKDPTVGIYTHHNLIDESLKLVDSFVLKDVRHANGSSMIYVDDVYQFVSTTAFFGDLLVMQYDKDWKFLGSKTLIEKAQWPQGLVYDEKTERYYVAYLAVDGRASFEVQAMLAEFDKDWNLLSNTALTDYDEKYMAGRPSVMLHEDKLYVTFDKESLNSSEKETEPNKDWQCQLSVLEI